MGMFRRFFSFFSGGKPESIIGSTPLPEVESKTPMPKVQPAKKKKKKKVAGKKKGTGQGQRRKLSSEMPKAKKPRIQRKGSGTRARRGRRTDHIFADDLLMDDEYDALDNGHQETHSYTSNTTVVTEDVSTPSYDGGWSSGGGGGGYSDGGGGGCCGGDD